MCVMCVYVFIFLKRQTLQGINTVSHQHISMSLLTSSTITTLRNNLQFSILIVNMTFYKNNKAKRSCWKKVSSTLKFTSGKFWLYLPEADFKVLSESDRLYRPGSEFWYYSGKWLCIYKWDKWGPPYILNTKGGCALLPLRIIPCTHYFYLHSFVTV